jgi:SOS-response transcriptional repressor LexA
VELPLLGLVAAGQPIEAVADQETVAVPEDLVSRAVGTTCCGSVATR